MLSTLRLAATRRTNHLSTLTRHLSTNPLLDSNYVHYSPFPAIEVDPHFLLGDIGQNWKGLGETTAILDGTTMEKRTFMDYYNRSASSAKAFNEDYNLKSGDVACMFSPNNVDYLPSVIGLMRIGCAVTTANPTYTHYELTSQLDKSGATVLITHPMFIETALTSAKNSKACKKVVVLGHDSLGADGNTDAVFTKYDGSTGYTSSHNTPTNVIKSSDIAFLPFSSGTTGLPKGTMLTHTNLFNNLKQFEEPEGKWSGVGDTVISPLPMFHIYAFVCSLLHPAYKGTTLITLSQFDLPNFCDLVQTMKPTRAHLVPPIILGLAKHPIVDNYDMTSLNMVVSAAAPLGSEVEDAVRSRLKIKCKQAWGMSELSPVGTVTPDTNLKEGSGTIGPVVSNTMGKIVCLETGKNLPPGEANTGEFCVKGPQVMRGYLNEPEKTAECVIDGWLHTGDIAYADEDGYFYIVDRLKELIKYKGFQVAPAELEALLCSHDKVADCAVIPFPDEAAGEVPRAYVVRNEGSNVSEQELKDFVGERAAHFKQLRGGVVFVDAIPKTASGKILRRVVIDMDKAAREAEAKA